MRSIFCAILLLLYPSLGCSVAPSTIPSKVLEPNYAQITFLLLCGKPFYVSGNIGEQSFRGTKKEIDDNPVYNRAYKLAMEHIEEVEGFRTIISVDKIFNTECSDD